MLRYNREGNTAVGGGRDSVGQSRGVLNRGCRCNGNVHAPVFEWEVRSPERIDCEMSTSGGAPGEHGGSLNGMVR